MPAKQFVLTGHAQKNSRKLPPHIHARLPKALHAIEQNPTIGTKLHGVLSGLYKYRVGDYRIIYTFSTKDSRVEIVAIEHRQGAYK